MGCGSSKRVEATVAADVYRPAPTSIALFDINAIEEPWLISTVHHHQPSSKPTSHVPAPILEKLDTFELASDVPSSWSEVSKALQHLKPTFQSPPPPPPPDAHVSPAADNKNPIPKNPSFHTLEELDAQLSTKKKDSARVTQLNESARVTVAPPAPQVEVEGIRPLRENSFIVRDRLEKEGKSVSRPSDGGRRRRDLLSEFPEKCPPGGEEAVVLYTTTLRGVRRTFEDCERARSAVEGWRVVVDERDVALHGGYLVELRELLGEGVAVPRLFVKGRYVGGVEQVVELNESGRLGELLDSARVRRGVGRRECEGCGGARFVPCLGCSGSCKAVDKDGNGMVRCGLCNENGLVHCPLCHPQ
ncbi:hypothetical protein AAC387_Pa10g0379 [Persea americana]